MQSHRYLGPDRKPPGKWYVASAAQGITDNPPTTSEDPSMPEMSRFNSRSINENEQMDELTSYLGFRTICHAIASYTP